MNDELKQWLRILKFGMPSVVAFALMIGGLAFTFINPEYNSPFSDSQLTGFFMGIFGAWFFWRMEVSRLKEKLKEINACQKS